MIKPIDRDGDVGPQLKAYFIEYQRLVGMLVGISRNAEVQALGTQDKETLNTLRSEMHDIVDKMCDLQKALPGYRDRDFVAELSAYAMGIPWTQAQEYKRKADQLLAENPHVNFTDFARSVLAKGKLS